MADDFLNSLPNAPESYDPKTLNSLIMEYLRGQKQQQKPAMQFIGRTAPLGVAGELLQDIGQRNQIKQLIGQQQKGLQVGNAALSAPSIDQPAEPSTSSPLSAPSLSGGGEGKSPAAPSLPSAPSLPTDTSAAPVGGSTAQPSSGPDTGNSAYQNAMRTSSQGETSNKFGAAALTNISPDTGGSKSYGPWGVNSKTGSAGEFARTYPHLGLTAQPGSSQFDQQWVNAARANPTAMLDAHQDWYHNHYFSPATATLTKNGIDPSIAANPGVQAYWADRTLQMGTVGQNRALAAARNATTPQDFLKTVSQVDNASVPVNFRSYLSTNPGNVRGLQNRINLRLQNSLGMTAPTQTATAGVPSPPASPAEGAPGAAGQPPPASVAPGAAQVPLPTPRPPTAPGMPATAPIMAPNGMPGGQPLQPGQAPLNAGMPPQVNAGNLAAGLGINDIDRLGAAARASGSNMPVPSMAQATINALSGGSAPGAGGASAVPPFNPTGQPSSMGSVPPQATPSAAPSMGAAPPTLNRPAPPIAAPQAPVPPPPTHGKPDVEPPSAAPTTTGQAPQRVQPSKPVIPPDQDAIRQYNADKQRADNQLSAPYGSSAYQKGVELSEELRKRLEVQHKVDPNTGYDLEGNDIRGWHASGMPRQETAPEKFQREKALEHENAVKMKQIELENAGKLKQTEQDQKYFGTIYTGLTGSASIASNQKQNIAALWDIANDPSFSAGFGSNAWLKMQRMGASMGIPGLEKNASPREAFNMLAARVLADQFSGMKSLSSEAGETAGRIFKPMLDIEEKANITPDDSLEGIRRKLRLLDRAGNLMMKFGDKADDYKLEHGALDPGFNKQFRSEMSKARITGAYSDHDKENSAIPEDTSSSSPDEGWHNLPGAGKGTVAPQPAPTSPPTAPSPPAMGGQPPNPMGPGPINTVPGMPQMPQGWAGGSLPSWMPEQERQLYEAGQSPHAAAVLGPPAAVIGGPLAARAALGTVRAPGHIINQALGTTGEHSRFIGPLLAGEGYAGGGAWLAKQVLDYLRGK